MPEKEKFMIVKCDFNVSDNCKKEWKVSKRCIRETKRKNNGKIICLSCSRKIKYTGRNNPNCKHSEIQDNMFKTIDTEAKSWFLGWIASDGSIMNNTITISLHTKDITVFNFFKEIIGDNSLQITQHQKRDMASFVINSQEMANDIRFHLGLKRDSKKHKEVKFPHHINNSLKIHFIRGFFEGDGTIRNPSLKESPECSITSNSDSLRKDIGEFLEVPFCDNNDHKSISWQGVNSLDVLGKIYESSKYYLSRKRDLYLDWCLWQPTYNTRSVLKKEGIKFSKTRQDAVYPSKARISDTGYDVTIVDIKKSFGNVILYNTGIKVCPPTGYYFDLVPRSSITKSGYIMANSFGVIDRSYRGELMIPLIKIDVNAPDLELPIKIAQLIPRPIQHFEIKEVEYLDESDRGDKGFGSSGK